MTIGEMSKDQLLSYKKQLIKLITKYKNLQLAKKVELNSAYGALGNVWFRFFDLRLAEAVTLSGKLSIQWVENIMNRFMNKLLGTAEDYVVAIDTDSLYVRFDAFVEKYAPGRSKDEIVGFLNNFAEKKIQPIIDSAYEELAGVMNAFKNAMRMKREVIAEKGIFIAKKRYILKVNDSEGVRFKVPELKMMGVETVKSSTPKFCRETLSEALEIIMSGSEEDVQSYIAETKKRFCALPIEDVAFPRSISDYATYKKKYDTEKGIPKGCPIHVRGSLLFNNMIKQHNLEKKYELIKNGEKIKFCYLQTPNIIKNDVISFINQLPPEFGLNGYVDYDKQFMLTFLSPLESILKLIGWSTEKVYKVDDFFV